MSKDYPDHKLGFIADLGEGFATIVKVVVGLLAVLVAAVVWLGWAYFSPAPEAASEVRPAPAAPGYSPVVPDVRRVVADHMGECFATPMGDVGKVIEQDNEMLTMTFRGGVKSTYRFDQVTSSACGPAVMK